MLPFRWELKQPDRAIGQSNGLKVECRPLEGLRLSAGPLQIGPLLGLEVVDAVDLGRQPLAAPGTVPEMIVRQDTLLVQYAPTTKRPVECQARWRVLPEGILDLQVSALTPGKWDGLAIQTRTRLEAPPHKDGTLFIDDAVSPPLVIYHWKNPDVCYAEFCHPQDGIRCDVDSDGRATIVRYRLFGHDLEKGVIVRGRLRGVILPQMVDLAAARAAYRRFLDEPPLLTL